MKFIISIILSLTFSLNTNLQIICKDAEDKKPEERQTVLIPENLKTEEKYNYQTLLRSVELYLRVEVKEDGYCSFSNSPDGKKYEQVGTTFKARPGKWIGAKTGLFIMNPQENSWSSWADVDWFIYLTTKEH